MIRTVPLGPRNRLAHLIVTALSEERARGELDTLAGVNAVPDGWLAPDEMSHAPALVARVRRAAEAVRGFPLVPRELILDDALAAAALLFDAGLYFETHEVLEPAWRNARGRLRETLQGLIQVAVGYQHLANGNMAGARALLDEGVARLRRSRTDAEDVSVREGRDASLARSLHELSRFVDGFTASLGDLSDPERMTVPPFPRLDRT